MCHYDRFCLHSRSLTSVRITKQFLVVHELSVRGRECSQFDLGVVIDLCNAMEQGFVVCGRQDGENNILREFNFSFFEDKIVPVRILRGVETAAQPLLEIVEQDQESAHIDAKKLNRCRDQDDGAHWEAPWLYWR